MLLQQCLPFTVLKRRSHALKQRICIVATVLTVYGIETQACLTLHGVLYVATVLTVYGIETIYYLYTLMNTAGGCNSAYRLRY